MSKRALDLAADVPPVLPSDDVQAIPPRYAACRTLRHAWEPSDKVEGSIPLHLSALGLICLRCTTMRLDGIDAAGLVKYRRYQYAPDYLRKKGQPKLYAPDYRLQVLTAALSDITIRSRRNGR